MNADGADPVLLADGFGFGFGVGSGDGIALLPRSASTSLDEPRLARATRYHGIAWPSHARKRPLSSRVQESITPRS